jgi:hypothetical protein
VCGVDATETTSPRSLTSRALLPVVETSNPRKYLIRGRPYLTLPGQTKTLTFIADFDSPLIAKEPILFALTNLFATALPAG